VWLERPEIANAGADCEMECDENRKGWSEKKNVLTSIMLRARREGGYC
jgi:hypothetical protein